MTTQGSLQRRVAGLALKATLAAIAIGVYYDVVMLRPLPGWVPAGFGLATVAIGAIAMAVTISFLLPEWRCVSVGSVIGLLFAATHLEMRASDTLIGPARAAVQALAHWHRFLLVLSAFLWLASWLAFRARTSARWLVASR